MPALFPGRAHTHYAIGCSSDISFMITARSSLNWSSSAWCGRSSKGQEGAGGGQHGAVTSVVALPSSTRTARVLPQPTPW